MSLVLDGTAGITFNNATTQASAGVVLQVVQATSTASASTTSTSFVTTGVSASITPKFSTSKVAIFITGQLYSSGTAIQSYLTIYRGATELSGNGASGNGFAPNAYNAAGAITAGATLNYLDSPATTSSTTYTIYLRTSSGTSYFNSASGTSTIILMEIAG